MTLITNGDEKLHFRVTRTQHGSRCKPTASALSMHIQMGTDPKQPSSSSYPHLHPQHHVLLHSAQNSRVGLDAFRVPSISKSFVVL